jgi:hypothetical protein
LFGTDRSVVENVEQRNDSLLRMGPRDMKTKQGPATEQYTTKKWVEPKDCGSHER